MVSLTKSTKSTKEKDVKRQWHLFDAKDQILGRLVSKIATILIGKNKINYVSYLDMGDNVVVINAFDIRVTGKKEKNKIYTNYSGYPGGLKISTFSKMKEKKPEEIIRRAVYGMLPKNKLRDRMITRLHIFKNEQHLFQDKFKNKI